MVLPWRAWRASEVLAVSIQVGAFLAAENFASSTKKHLGSSNGLTIGISALGLDALPGGTADSLIEIGGLVEHCSSHVQYIVYVNIRQQRYRIVAVMPVCVCVRSVSV